MSFEELKAVWLRNKILLDILKAIFFRVDWVSKLIQERFQTMAQKLVQRYETKVGADACNASHVIKISLPFEPIKKMYVL